MTTIEQIQQSDDFCKVSRTSFRVMVACVFVLAVMSAALFVIAYVMVPYQMETMLADHVPNNVSVELARWLRRQFLGIGSLVAISWIISVGLVRDLGRVRNLLSRLMQDNARDVGRIR